MCNYNMDRQEVLIIMVITSLHVTAKPGVRSGRHANRLEEWSLIAEVTIATPVIYLACLARHCESRHTQFGSQKFCPRHMHLCSPLTENSLNVLNGQMESGSFK